MSIHDPLEIKAKINDQLSVSMSYGADGIHAVWRPDVPRSLTEDEMQRYTDARDRLLEKIAKVIGVDRVAILD